MTAARKEDELQLREDMLQHVHGLLKESWFFQISSADFQAYLKEIRPTIVPEGSHLKKSSLATDFLILVIEGEIQKKDSAFGRDELFRLRRGDTFFFSTFDYLNYVASSDTLIFEIPLDRSFSSNVRAFAQDLDLLKAIRIRPTLLPVFRKYYQTEFVRRISQQEIERSVKIVEVDRSKKLFLDSSSLYFVDLGKLKLVSAQPEHTQIASPAQILSPAASKRPFVKESGEFVIDLDVDLNTSQVKEALAIENCKICQYNIPTAAITDAVLYLSQAERQNANQTPPEPIGDFDLSHLRVRDSQIDIKKVSQLKPFNKLLVVSSDEEYWAMSLVNMATVLGSQFTQKMAQELLAQKEILSIIDIQSVSCYLETKGIVTRKRVIHSQNDVLQNKVYVWCRHNRLFLILNNLSLGSSNEVLVFESKTGLFPMSRKQLQASPYLLEIERNQFERHRLEASKQVFDKADLYGERFFKTVLEKRNVLTQNLFTFKFFQTAIVLLVPTLIYGYMNQSVTSQNGHLLFGLSLALLAFLIFQSSAIFFYQYYLNEFTTGFRSSISSFFHKVFLAQKQSQLKVGFVQARIGLLEFTFSAVRFQKTDLPIYAGLLIFYVLYVGWYSLEAALLLVVLGAITFGTVYYLRKRGGFTELNSVQLKQDLIEYYFESIRNLGLVSILDKNEVLVKRLGLIMRQTLIAQNEYSLGLGRVSLVGMGLYKVGSILVLGAVVYEMTQSKISPMQLFGVSLFLSYLTMPFQNIVNYLSNMNTTGLLNLPVHVLRMEGLDPNKKNEAFHFNESIHLNRIYFKYSEKANFSVQDLTLKVKKNSFHLILGRSNSGKTTVAKLLTHVLEPQHGQVLIDERETQLFDRMQVMSELGLCTQAPELMSGTIRSNIIPPATTIKALQFDEIANEINFFQSLRDFGLNLDSDVDVLASNIPNLIKKKIQIIRYIMSDRDTLIFDEPNLYLTTEDTRRLFKLLRRLAKEKTVIVFSHSLEAAVVADQISVLRAGRIVEEGEFYRLINLSGELAEYFRNQVGEQ